MFCLKALSNASASHRRFQDIDPSDWNNRARMPTQRHCWVRAALETINARHTECLLTFQDSFAPLIIRGEKLRLRFIGDRIAEPYDVLCNEDAVEGLAAAILETALAIRFRPIAPSAPILGALQRVSRGRRSFLIEPCAWGCPYIELDGSWREPEAHFSASWRSSFRRMRRKAENMGQVTFDIVTPKLNEVRALLNEAIAVEARSWMKAAGVAMTVSRWRARFYKRFAKYAASEGILRLCFLRIEGRPVAMEYAVECGGRFFAHKIAYDESFEHCSPGTLLRLEILRRAAERGLQSYEFQGKDAPWTYIWTKTVRPMVCVNSPPARSYFGFGA
jgi:hypothetical protein